MSSIHAENLVHLHKYLLKYEIEISKEGIYGLLLSAQQPLAKIRVVYLGTKIFRY